MDDLQLLAQLREEWPDGAIVRVSREDKEDDVEVKIYTAQPGMLLGRRLANLYVIRDGLKRQFGEVKLQIIEVRYPDLEPT